MLAESHSQAAITATNEDVYRRNRIVFFALGGASDMDKARVSGTFSPRTTGI